MNPQVVKKVGLAVLVVVLQIVFFRHLKIFEIQPDVILIFLLWYMSQSSRTAAILMAAFLGFAQDALLDLWGLNMFAKVFLTFIGHGWISGNMDLRTPVPRVLTVVLFAAIVHNLIFVILSLAVEPYTAEIFFWRQWIGSAIYTTTIAGIIQLFRS